MACDCGRTCESKSTGIQQTMEQLVSEVRTDRFFRRSQNTDVTEQLSRIKSNIGLLGDEIPKAITTGACIIGCSILVSVGIYACAIWHIVDDLKAFVFEII